MHPRRELRHANRSTCVLRQDRQSEEGLSLPIKIWNRRIAVATASLSRLITSFGLCSGSPAEFEQEEVVHTAAKDEPTGIAVALEMAAE